MDGPRYPSYSRKRVLSADTIRDYKRRRSYRGNGIQSPRQDQSLISANNGEYLPNEMFSEMTLTIRTGELVSNVGTVQGFIVRGNDIHLPYPTDPAQHPLGYLKYKDFYEKYLVFGSRIHLTAYSTSQAEAGTSNLASIMVYPAVTSVPPTSVNWVDYSERPYALTREMSFSQSGNAAVDIKSYMTTAMIDGTTKSAVRSDPGYSGSSGGSPEVPWGWFIYQHGIINAAKVVYVIRVTYYVLRYSRVQP